MNLLRFVLLLVLAPYLSCAAPSSGSPAATCFGGNHVIEARLDDPIIESLPKKDGLYVWTNDASSIVDWIKRCNSIDEDSFENLLRIYEARDGTAHDHSEAEFFEAISRLVQNTISSLSGQVCVCFLQTDRGSNDILIIAETDASEREIEEILEDASSELFWELPFVNIQLNAKTAPRMSIKWSHRDNVIVFGSNPNLIREYLDFATRTSRPNDLLIQDRKCLRLISRIEKSESADPTISFLAFGDGIPVLANSPTLSGLGLQLPSFKEYWHDLFLDELLGIAGTIVLTEREQPNRRFSVRCEVFVLSAQPGKGVYSILNDSGLGTVKIPASFGPINSFAAYKVDGGRGNNHLCLNTVRHSIC